VKWVEMAALVPTSDNATKRRPGDGAFDTPWAWVYLTALLALAVGFDDARAVVQAVRWEERS
jgi:hypothetical protein